MGLDMYLKKTIYVGANYTHRKVKCNIELVINNEKINVDTNLIEDIVLAAGYWRKANQIHNWFVENVQENNDDCSSYDVTPEQLVELNRVCKLVLKAKGTNKAEKKAKELLPTSKGFFFGGNDYDDLYYNQIKDTIEIIKPILKDKKRVTYNGEIFLTLPYGITYGSSW